MAELRDILQKYVNLDYEDLLKLGTHSLAAITPYFESVSRQMGGEITPTQLGICVLGTCLAVDGKLTDLECRFVSDLFDGVPREQVRAVAENYADEQSRSIVDGLYDNCPAEYRNDFMQFCICVLAVDERVSGDETEFVRRLFA